jgi:hypothetical protein
MTFHGHDTAFTGPQDPHSYALRDNGAQQNTYRIGPQTFLGLQASVDTLANARMLQAIPDTLHDFQSALVLVEQLQRLHDVCQ